MPRLIVSPDDVRRGLHPDDGLHRFLDVQTGSVVPKSFSSTAISECDLIADLFGDPLGYPVKNQGESNFCVRFSRCSALELIAMKAGARHVALSPLFAAWDDAMPGYQGQNRGTQIYLGAEAAARVGTCLEASNPWEKDALKDYLQRLKVQPPEFAYREAERHQGIQHYRVNDADVAAIIEALNGRKIPVQIGAALRQGFWDCINAGRVIDNRGAITGYHAILIVGIVKINGIWCWKILNSWGPNAGNDGYVFWPVDLSQEFTDNRVFSEVEIVR